MKRPACALASAVALALLAAPGVMAQGRHSSPPGGTPDAGAQSGSRNSYANPSAVIAAELAFARDAQVRGQWTAFVTTAAPDAVMFTPGMVWAQRWLKGRANPAVAVKWQPQEIWSSCDGSIMVSHGAWQGPKGIGYYTTIWQRQPDGKYKWVFDHGDVLAQALLAPEMLTAHVADCPDRPRRPDGPPPQGKPKKVKAVKLADLPPLDPAHRTGSALDGSIKWDVTVDPDGGRVLSVTWQKDGGERALLFDQVAATKPAE